MTYKIVVPLAVEKDLVKIPASDASKVRDAIEQLSIDPRPNHVKKLKGQHKGKYRIRCGDYRVLYEIHDGHLLILVIKVGNRKSVYM